jgi:hypothetical protein
MKFPDLCNCSLSDCSCSTLLQSLCCNRTKTGMGWAKITGRVKIVLTCVKTYLVKTSGILTGALLETMAWRPPGGSSSKHHPRQQFQSITSMVLTASAQAKRASFAGCASLGLSASYGVPELCIVFWRRRCGCLFIRRLLPLEEWSVSRSADRSPAGQSGTRRSLSERHTSIRR